MADPVTIGVAVSWGISALGWVVSPIITKLINEGFSYLGIDGAEKLKELETKVLQLQLLMEAVDWSPHREKLELLFQNLRSAFYEAEDILDDVEYESLERQVLSPPVDKVDSQIKPSSSRNWVRKIHSALPKTSLLKKQVNSITSDDPPLSVPKKKLKKILEKIETIVTEVHATFQALSLSSGSNVDKIQIVAEKSRGSVTTMAPPRVVIGRDNDRDKIIAMLRETIGDGQQESSSVLSPYSIIGIHGIPGSGKSTLAQYVCTHEEDSMHFNIVIWVHVSQNFSVKTILREMIEQITGKPGPQFDSLTALQKKLKEELRGKRFLLVLDDVWYSKNANHHEKLQQLLSPLNVAKAGSRILATSRTSDALLALGAMKHFPIRDLDDDAFLKLFRHYALDYARIDGQDRTEFQMIGDGIAKKLNRSPLAATTVGRQLCVRPDVEVWRNARDGNLLNKTMGALWWSYQHLDEQVKRCFSYCSIFPRRYLLDPEYLVRLWVAEGFVTSHNTGEELEAVAQGYFYELVSASFLQPVDGGKERYRIHDLLHDLVKKVASSDCFRAGNGWEGEFPPYVRHLSVENCKLYMITNKITKLKNLRTLIISFDENDTTVEEKAFLENMFMGLSKLRVLQITPWRAGTFSFPDSMGRLKHLRYLSVSRHTGCTEVTLPSAVFKLYHMQLLDCPSISFSSSCEDMVKLISLRHLLCLGSLNVPNIGRLVSLQTFRCFRVEKKPGYELWQLEHLNKLKNKLVICGLQNVGRKEDALKAKLDAKERLRNLTLEWSSDALQNCSADLQAEVLEGLRPPLLHLEKLRLRWYNGSRYPDWVVGVRCLCLYRCSRLGAIHGWHGLSHLLKLKILECSWDALADNMEHLTSLQTLVIDRCNDLRSLPVLPQSLQHFKLSGCDNEFMRSCKTVRHENHKKLQHVRTVIVGWGSHLKAEPLDYFKSDPVVEVEARKLEAMVPLKEKGLIALILKLLLLYGLALVCLLSVFARLLVGSFLLSAPQVAIILLAMVWLIWSMLKEENVNDEEYW